MSLSAGGYLRPRAVERVFGQILAALIRVGVVRGHFHALEVRGRKSGRTIAFPVAPIEFGGRRYLVCARGNSNWVRNARAAGEIARVRTFRRGRYVRRELPPGERAPVLKAYLDRFATEVQRFFSVPKGSPVAAFDELAPGYPVFELLPADDGAVRP